MLKKLISPPPSLHPPSPALRMSFACQVRFVFGGHSGERAPVFQARPKCHPPSMAVAGLSSLVGQDSLQRSFLSFRPPPLHRRPTTLIEARGPLTKRRATGRMNPPCEKMHGTSSSRTNGSWLDSELVSTGRFCLLCAIIQLHLPGTALNAA